MKIRASSDRGEKTEHSRRGRRCRVRIVTNASEALGVHSREKDGSVALCSAIYRTTREHARAQYIIREVKLREPQQDQIPPQASFNELL